MEMPAISRGRALAYGALALALLALAGKALLGDTRHAAAPASAPSGEAVLDAEPAEASELVVHVVGAVRRPGLYRLTDGSRVDDAIAEAGGPTRRALLAGVNLASPIADGQQIVVPARGPGATAAAGSGAGLAGTAAPGGRVHLNTATLEQLDALPGIGPVTAQRILDYREEKGAFQSVDELDAVSGIGPARLEQLRELVDL
jgi:competence protein ComEA